MGVVERREREREERRSRILDAAEGLFLSNDAATATMADVAAAAELSKGTLYLYFKNKDALYLAIAHRSLSSMVDALESVNGATMSGLQLFQRFSEIQRSFATERPEHLKNLLAWMNSGFHADDDDPAFAAYQELVGRLMKRVVGVVELGRRDGSIRTDVNSLEVVMHTWGGTMGVWMIYMNRNEVAKRLPAQFDFESLVPGFADLIVRAIAARPEDQL